MAQVLSGSGEPVYTRTEVDAMAEKKAYAAAMIKFLDRDSQTEKVMTYPITEVSLINVTTRETKAYRKFVVNSDGLWEESTDLNL